VIALVGISGGGLAEDTVGCKSPPFTESPVEKIGNIRPVYRWQALAGCSSYQLYLSNAAGILSVTWVAAEDAGCGSGTCEYMLDQALTDGEDYGWWVRGWQPREGTSSWSAGNSFTVDLDICAKPPVPLAPAGEINFSAPEYHWIGAYGCDWYQLSASGPDGNVLHTWVMADGIACVYDAVCSYSAEKLLPPGAYFWWIRGWSRGTPMGRWTSATQFYIADDSPLP